MGGVVKVVKKGAKELTGDIKKVGKIVGGDILDDALGLDSIGGAVEDAFNDLGEIVAVASGQYHDDMKKIRSKQKQIESRVAQYNKEVGKLERDIDRLLAFEEIFKLAAGNRMDEYVDKYGSEIDKLVEEYKKAVTQLKNEYDFVIGLTEGSFLEKIVGSLVMIMGGLQSDFQDVLSGNANGETWKRVITVTIMVIVIVLMFLIPGMQGVALNTAMYVAITLTMINTFMTLDGMYANGAATGAIMGALDTIFNDVLNLDDRIGKDFDKFDKDHEDYQEMVMYTQLVMAIGAMYAGWTATTPDTATTAGQMSMNPTFEQQIGIAGTEYSTTATTSLSESIGRAATSTTSYANGLVEISSESFKDSTLSGVKFSTYSDIYKAYTTATSVKDVVSANEQYKAMQDKMREDQLKLEEAIASKISKGFTKSYKDVEYFLQDQQEFVDRYVFSMTAQNMYVDPYGTTPVANIRFTPDKDTRVLSFGFEELFDESKLAGSSDYFKSILYGG